MRALVDESDINRSQSRAIDHKTETNHEDPRSSQRTIIDSMIDAHYTHVPTAWRHIAWYNQEIKASQ